MKAADLRQCDLAMVSPEGALQVGLASLAMCSEHAILSILFSSMGVRALADLWTMEQHDAWG